MCNDFLMSLHQCGYGGKVDILAHKVTPVRWQDPFPPVLHIRQLMLLHCFSLNGSHICNIRVRIIPDCSNTLILKPAPFCLLCTDFSDETLQLLARGLLFRSRPYCTRFLAFLIFLEPVLAVSILSVCTRVAHHSRLSYGCKLLALIAQRLF